VTDNIALYVKALTLELLISIWSLRKSFSWGESTVVCRGTDFGIVDIHMESKKSFSWGESTVVCRGTDFGIVDIHMESKKSFSWGESTVVCRGTDFGIVDIHMEPKKILFMRGECCRFL